MPRTLTVGLDGSPESLAAADWAAREALLRDLPLRLVNASQWQAPAYAPASGLDMPPLPRDLQHAAARRLLDDARAHIAGRHPGLPVEAEDIPGLPVPALLKAADDAELLVLGSRGLGKVAGFLLGSVSLAVLAGSERPVVLVRSAEPDGQDRPADDPAGARTAGTDRRDVVLGLGLDKPDDRVLDFAFDAASRRAARLRVVHGWTLPPYSYGGDLMPELDDDMARQVRRELSGVLRPWQERFPAVEVSTQTTVGGAGPHLVDASRDAALVVVGRRIRRSAVGTHIGPVTQALLHHAAAPVAVIPHD
ncbi:universal stress protein [Streptomyces sp. NPDC008313]|uniref:universal stress protein n=1 Tax=Streptomyces sp. NPDC008313 TaxID=3364826 RepID=UPI0036E67E39